MLGQGPAGFRPIRKAFIVLTVAGEWNLQHIDRVSNLFRRLLGKVPWVPGAMTNAL